MPSLLPLGILHKVLQNLLRERVSIRDLLTIVETLSDYSMMTKDPDLLTEYVRLKLSRSFLGAFIQADGVLPLIMVDQKVEDLFTKSVQRTENGSYLTVEPVIAESVVDSMKKEIEKAIALNIQPIIFCSPALRRHLRKMMEPFAPSAMVISHAEMLQNTRIQAIGKVTLKHGG